MAGYQQRVGARIRARREENRLSRGDLARLLPGKTDANDVYRWETGKHRPRDETLEHIAAALNVDVSYFVAPTVGDIETPDPFADNGSAVEQHLARIEHKLDELPASTAGELRDLVHGLVDRYEQAMEVWSEEAMVTWNGALTAWNEQPDLERLESVEASLTEIKAMLLVPMDDREDRWTDIVRQLESTKHLTEAERERRDAELAAEIRRITQAIRG